MRSFLPKGLLIVEGVESESGGTSSDDLVFFGPVRRQHLPISK